MVDIVTQSPGLSAEEIERYITIPIETQTAGDSQSARDPHHFALWPVGREAAVHVRLHLRGGAAAGAQSIVAAAATAQQRAAADLPDQPDRRDLPLSSGRSARLQRAGSQDLAGLGAAAPFPRRARGDRRHRLGRQDENLRAGNRLQQAHGLRPHAAAAAADAEQQQHQCRRQHGQHRAAGRGGAWRRPHPQHGRSQQHHADPERRQSCIGARRRDSHGRPQAAPRHRRQGRCRRYRAGHSAHAARREEHAHHQARSRGGGAHQQLRSSAARRAYRAHL